MSKKSKKHRGKGDTRSVGGPARVFQIDVTIENGQLHEALASEDDRQEMISRLEEILTGPDGEVKNGVVQILIDQLRTNHGHEPIIIHSGREDGDEEEVIAWNSQIVSVDENRKKQIVDIKVTLDKYRQTKKTPRTKVPGDLFKFKNKKGPKVETECHLNGKDSVFQHFYKFTIEAENPLKGLPPLKLDPCIICDR